MNISCKRPQRVAVLGATGSIGRNAVAVCAANPGRFEVVCLTCATRGNALRECARQCGARELYCAADAGVSTLRSEDEVNRLLASEEVDVVLCAIQGIAALRSVMTALKAGKTVALATKEVLVGAGEWVMETARRYGGRILPVDSEHCALFQCMQGAQRESVRRVWITCSGGPFHNKPGIDLHQVTPEQASHHPAWNMGPKITLDSATLMNKAFEIIEAAWLYGLSAEQIGVVIHPQAVVHSMVEYVDGAVLAQLGVTDMKLPIQYCLTWPERIPALAEPLDFSQMMRLDFSPPDEQRFPALKLARAVLRRGGLAGAVFNAANDAACLRFRQGTLAFDEIVPAVAAALEQTPGGEAHSFAVLDEAARVAVKAVNEYRPEYG